MILFHKNCTDGTVALWVLKSVYTKARYIGLSNGDKMPDVTGMNVIIVDYCPNRKDVIKMKQQAKHLVILDHHISNQRVMKNIDNCYFDNNKCGATLAWNYLYGNKKNALVY